MPTQTNNSNTLGTVASTAGTAAGMAAAGPLGAAIGGALGNIISGLFGGGGTTFAKASTEVHEYFRYNLPQAFLDWMKANHPGSFGSLDEVKGLHLLWAMNQPAQGAIKHVANRRYQLAGGWPATVQLFASLGYDLAASDAKEKEVYPLSIEHNKPPAGEWDGAHCNFIHPENVVMLQGGGTPAVPSPAVDKMAEIAGKEASGAPMTEGERRTLKDMERASGGTSQAGFGAGMAILLVLLLLGSMRGKS